MQLETQLTYPLWTTQETLSLREEARLPWLMQLKEEKRLQEIEEMQLQTQLTYPLWKDQETLSLCFQISPQVSAQVSAQVAQIEMPKETETRVRGLTLMCAREGQALTFRQDQEKVSLPQEAKIPWSKRCSFRRIRDLPRKTPSQSQSQVRQQ